jgi:hypothetical protein
MATALRMRPAMSPPMEYNGPGGDDGATGTLPFDDDGPVEEIDG